MNGKNGGAIPPLPIHPQGAMLNYLNKGITSPLYYLHTNFHHAKGAVNGRTEVQGETWKISQ
jgi:hypothetical protein